VDTALTSSDIAALHRKLDQLTAQLQAQERQIGLLIQVAQVQQRQIEEFEELKRDVVPIVNHLIKLAIDELAEVNSDFQVEDLFFVLKRLLRDTRMLAGGLNRLEMMMELYDESQVLGKQIFSRVVAELDRMERAGYFTFARGGLNIVERIVTEFTEEDVRLLGENIVLILNTIKDMTQPEILHFIRNTLLIAEREIEKPVDSSWLSLVGQMRQPEVRRGLALTLRVLQVIGAQAQAPQPGN